MYEPNGKNPELGDSGAHGDQIQWRRQLEWVIAFGLFAIVIYAAASAKESRPAAAGAALLLAGASLFVGALVGFVFGIPRALQREDGSPDESGGYRANTNLEQISDWITKIIVGVGLTQLSDILPGLGFLGEHLGPTLGGGTASGPVSSVSVVFFLVAGFLFGYLWTRLYMLGLLKQADLSGVIRQVEQLATREDLDVDAYGLVYQFLNSTSPDAAVEDKELSRAMRYCSARMRQQIFGLATDTRRDNWEDPLRKSVVARTIPVFRALIDATEPAPRHEYFGQLGYALKEQPEPDVRAALSALDRAIEQRGSWQSKGWVTYEANRAECRILLDAQFQSGSPSNKEEKKSIVSDLKAAATWDFTCGWLKEPPYSEWMKLNGVSMEQLQSRE